MERKKLTHFYFDWNIFKYINTPRNSEDDELSKLIYSIKDGVYIAYSPFHIAGLTKNFDESKWDYIIKDCNLITKITNNLCLFYDAKNQIHLEHRSPLEMFKDQLEIDSFTENFDLDKLFMLIPQDKRDEFKNNFDSIKQNKELEKVKNPCTNSLLNSENPEEAFKQLILFGKNFQTDPGTYKQMRASISGVSQILKILPEAEIEKANTILKSHGIDKNINQLEIEDLIQLSKKFIEPKFDTQISNSYAFKDLFGLTKPEEITRKNTFKNIIDDSFHLEMAQYSLFYISEDKSNLEKAKLTSKEMGLNTKIFTIEEVNKYIRNNLFTVKGDDQKK